MLSLVNLKQLLDYHATHKSITYRHPLRFALVGPQTSIRLHPARHSMSTIALRSVKEDGSVEDITEEDLYRYTRHRWVYNDAKNLSQRYLKFNLQGLVRVATEAASKAGAHRCTEVLKCKEGMNNKAYLLTMDNGSVIFAKLPTPSAGPSFYTTASEVATRTFLRDILDIPTPRIIAWSAQKANPVGAEYILEERAVGQPLGTFWKDWDRLPMVPRFGIVRKVVEIERRLAETTFQHSGCIYFKEDFPQGDSLITTNTTAPSCLERFTLGPLVNVDYWEGRRASMDLDRGPFNSALEYVKVKAINEMKFVETQGYPRVNPARSLTEPEQPEEMLDLLRRFLELTPAMIAPSPSETLNASSLWHPDLHINNLFVDPNTMQITNIIDWQSTVAAPFFFQSGVPILFRHKDSTSLNLGCDEKEYVKAMVRSEELHKYYLKITKRDNPRHWTALQLHDEIRVQPVEIVQHAWERNMMFFVRRALMRIASKWGDLCPNAGPCPVSFSQQEFALWDGEVEKREAIGSILKMIEDNYGLNPDGTVERDRYDEMQSEMTRLKAIFAEAADDEEEKLLCLNLWPYQDTVGQLPVAV